MEALKARDDVSSWNDDRLDELATDVKAGFEKVDARFDKVDKRFEKIDEKFERLYHVLIAGMVVIVGALIGVPAIGG
jgi:F0F1-type ATP synthase assembly protein I